MKDPLTTLAFSIYSSPGVYALLIGSGVSRAADIMTGWETTIDLIKKVANLRKEKPEPNPEAWYYNTFGKEPTYTNLLKYLAPTKSERNLLLRPYFEPSEEDREKGLKIPTEAHRAIASLVRQGYIKMILTTNFDRLMEIALQDEGIPPDVISTDDALKGAMPYVHSKCVIVKLHGDYKDTRIKNTPKELKHYSDKLNNYLDSILDEFGLIVCGWSGEWDVALRNAIMRCPSRRFTTYWTTRGEPSEEAQKLINQRRAQVIQIESADKFFTELKEKTEALSEFEPHPMSVQLAVAITKKYLEENHRIKLDDLIRNETKKLYQNIVSSRFPIDIKRNELEKEQSRRIREYEELAEILYNIIITLSWYDREGKHSELITHAIELIGRSSKHGGGYTTLINLRLYPSLLLLYGVGISSVSTKAFNNLYAAIMLPKVMGFYGEVPAYQVIYPDYIFQSIPTKILWKNKTYTAANEKVAEVCRKGFSLYIPDDEKYNQMFDIFEYILCLIYYDQKGSGLVGRFKWRYYNINELAKEPIEQYIEEGLAQGNEWGLLKAGFFAGSVERFNKSLQQIHKFLHEKRWEYE